MTTFAQLLVCRRCLPTWRLCWNFIRLAHCRAISDWWRHMTLSWTSWRESRWEWHFCTKWELPTGIWRQEMFCWSKRKKIWSPKSQISGCPDLSIHKKRFISRFHFFFFVFRNRYIFFSDFRIVFHLSIKPTPIISLWSGQARKLSETFVIIYLQNK